jgi:hypothetical protein
MKTKQTFFYTCYECGNVEQGTWPNPPLGWNQVPGNVSVYQCFVCVQKHAPINLMTEGGKVPVVNFGE